MKNEIVKSEMFKGLLILYEDLESKECLVNQLSMELDEADRLNKAQKAQLKVPAKKDIEAKFYDRSRKVQSKELENWKEVHSKKISDEQRANTRKRIIQASLRSLLMLAIALLLLWGASILFFNNWWVLFVEKTESLSLATYLLTICFAFVGYGGIAHLFSSREAKTLLEEKVCFISAIVHFVIGGIFLAASVIVEGPIVFLWILGYPTIGIGHFVTLGMLVALSLLPVIIGVPAIFVYFLETAEKENEALVANKPFLPNNYMHLVDKSSEYTKAYELDASQASVKADKFISEIKNANEAILKYNYSLHDQSVQHMLLSQVIIEEIEHLNKRISDVDFLSATDKTIETVGLLIFLLESGRADSLKESLQLLDAKEFRKNALIELQNANKKLDKIGNTLNKINLSLNKAVGILTKIYQSNETIAKEVHNARLNVSARLSSLENKIQVGTTEIKKSINSASATLNSSLQSIQKNINSIGVIASNSSDAAYKLSVMDNLQQIRNSLTS